MTFTYDTVQQHPPLPAEYHERCAYMRLYSALQHDAPSPSRATFGAEVDVLASRGHLTTTPTGYALTDAGIAHWEDYLRDWNAGPRPSAHRSGAMPAYTRVLMALAQCESWTLLAPISKGYNRTHCLNLCKKMEAQGLAELKIDESNRWIVRLTDDGRVIANEIEMESAS